MQAFGQLIRLTPRATALTATKRASRTLSNMSLLPRFVTGEFAPLFRLLDEYDTRRGVDSIRAFQPRFDVRESDGAYELHGELPGINQSDVNIEFSNPHTIVISGHSERTFESGTPPAGLIEGGREEGQITGGDEQGHENGRATSEVHGGKGKTTKQREPKYWISERSTGEFHRSFSFPARVDQDAVKASLKDGVLNIVVPKAAPAPIKKIVVAGE